MIRVLMVLGLCDGYHDAAAQAGAGLTRTDPADIFLPPLFAVDHILTRGATRRPFAHRHYPALTTAR